MTEPNGRNVEDENANSASPCGDCRESMEHLAILSEAWSSQNAGLWTVFGTFWATNAVLLVALFNGGETPTNPLVAWVVCMVGCAAAVVWTIAQVGAHLRQLKLESAFRKLESRIISEPDLHITSQLSKVPWARIIMVACSIVVFIGWLILLHVLLLHPTFPGTWGCPQHWTPGN